MPWKSKEAEAAWARRRYWRQVRQGVCVCCQKPWGGPRVLCPACADRKRPQWLAAVNATRAERRKRRECTRCGQPLHPEADAGRVYCMTCRQGGR